MYFLKGVISMKGKNVYLTDKEMIVLLAVLKLWNDYSDEDLKKYMYDFGLSSAWYKIYCKYMKDRDCNHFYYPDSDSFIKNVLHLEGL